MAPVHQPDMMSESEHERRDRRKGSYHLVASRNKLPADQDDEEDDTLFRYLTSAQPGQTSSLLQAKKQLLRELAVTGGDVDTPGFREALERLLKFCDMSNFDARKKPSKHKAEQSPKLEGMWISLSKPRFPDCAGTNDDGEYMYTLGRMSFDMFRPTKLVCSIQGTFNPVHVLSSRDVAAIEHVPNSLKDELKNGNNVLRTYDVVTAFSIEPRNDKFGPNSPNKVVDRPIEGLMTTYGYVISNPDEPQRLSIWWTGGSIEVIEDSERWHRVFDALPNRELKEKTRLFGARIMMGAATDGAMEEDGRMSYHLKRPIGGHETAYVDLLYLDDTLRIAKANTGVIYVFARIPYFPDE